MKRLSIAGLCLVSMLVVGMALAGTASAAVTASWSVCSEGKEGSLPTKYTEEQCGEAAKENKGKWEDVELAKETKDKVTVGLSTITLTDTKTLLGESVVRCDGPGEEAEGEIEGPNKSLITAAKVKEAKTNCRGLKGGCKATEIEEVKGVDLPWKSELYATESTVQARPEADGNGEPGWVVKCNTIGGPKEDICKQESGKPEILSLANVLQLSPVRSLLVLISFLKKRLANCTEGGKESGKVDFSFPILLRRGLSFRTP
jgi:hypothetical protein